MLPAPRRLKRPAEFAAVVREGRRAATATVVVHLRRTDPSDPPVTRVGFVVSKKVGNAVVRNRVKRRLRHLATAMPEGFDVVVRALPPAAGADDLGPDLDDAVRRALRKAEAC